MTFGIIFILLMMALGGFAAYQGDRVGMAVGRKRLTIFGLRPKYTSRIITVLTGIIIVTITMVSVLLISHTARQSLFGLEELQREISSLSVQVSNLQEQQRQLQSENAELQQLNRTLLEETETLQEQNEMLREQSSALEMQRQRLEDDVQRLEMELKNRRDDWLLTSVLIYDWLLQQPLVYTAGQLIDFYVIDVPETRSTLEASVRDALEQLNQKVLRDGAGEYPPGSGWALMLEEVDGAGNVILTEEEKVKQLVDAIWFTPGLESVVLLAVSETHTLETLPVVPGFYPLVNRVIYPVGAVVDTRLFDGRLEGRELFNQVWVWLQSDVRQAAVERGVLQRPDGTVTAPMEPGELYELVENIRAFQGPVRVSAVAERDVQTGDELPLRFVLEAVDSRE